MGAGTGAGGCTAGAFGGDTEGRAVAGAGLGWDGVGWAMNFEEVGCALVYDSIRLFDVRWNVRGWRSTIIHVRGRC